MGLTFQHGTKLVLTDGVDRYELLVSSATANQTFVETNQSVKTIHDRYLVDRTFVTEKGAVSLSFSCHLSTDGASDGILFEWFGFNKVADKYLIKPLFDATPLSGSKEILDVYIQTTNAIYKIDTCVGENISFKLSRKEVLSVNITATGSDLTEVVSIPENGTLYKQEDATFQNGTTIIAGYPRIAGITCELTRSIMWAGKQTLHDIGSIYKNKTPVLTNFSISGTITQNKIDNVNQYQPTTAINIQYGSSFEIILDACNTTDSWGMDTVHKKITDYKLLPSASNSYIKF